MDVKELFLMQKESEHQGTIAVYEKIPRDRLDWRPAEGMLPWGSWRGTFGGPRRELAASRSRAIGVTTRRVFPRASWRFWAK